MRKLYILLKDTPEFYKGAVFEEACDDGTQDFVCITRKFIAKRYIRDWKDLDWNYTRRTVINNPEWFAKAESDYKAIVETVKKEVKK